MDRLRWNWRRRWSGRGEWRRTRGAPLDEETEEVLAEDVPAPAASTVHWVDWRWPEWHWSEVRLLERELVADCEDFLLGHYADRLDRQSAAVPAWAWTNLLAHGTEEEVRQVAAGGGRGTAGTRGWRAARAYLATELLAAVGPDSSLVDLQRKVLAPLELRLSAGLEPPLWDAQRWVVIVRSALHDYQHSHRT